MTSHFLLTTLACAQPQCWPHITCSRWSDQCNWNCWRQNCHFRFEALSAGFRGGRAWRDMNHAAAVGGVSRHEHIYRFTCTYRQKLRLRESEQVLKKGADHVTNEFLAPYVKNGPVSSTARSHRPLGPNTLGRNCRSHSAPCSSGWSKQQFPGLAKPQHRRRAQPGVAGPYGVGRPAQRGLIPLGALLGSRNEPQQQ